MANVILLSDNLSNLIIGDSRYMAPYVLSTQLEKAGFSVVVIDHFTGIPNFFEFIGSFIDETTLFVGIASTFLSHAPAPDRYLNREYRDVLLNYQLSLLGNNREAIRDKYDNTGLWLESRNSLQDWLEKLRERLNKAGTQTQVILGGTKAPLLIREKSDRLDFDYFALSASDVSIVEFAKSLRDKLAPKYYDFNGYRVIDNREELKSKNCPEMVFSPKYAVQPKESLPIEISRGCIFSCKFCHYDKKESLRKDLGILKSEFVRNFELFGTTVYHFCDDCFNDSRKKVDETCNAILGLPFKIEWVSFARVDIAVRFPETLDLMVESGARGLFWGIESFNYEAAKKAGKRIPPDEVKDFLLRAYERHNNNCLFEGSFIVGLPGETEESLLETAKWLVSHKAFDFINASPLYLLPYQKELDKVSVDFADFSRHPEGYGISITEGAQQWSHQTMNSDQAAILSHQLLKTWTLSDHNTILRNIFDYPTLRSLGFSKAEIWDMGKNQKNAFSWGQDIMTRYQNHKKNYWKTLIEGS